MSSLRVALFQFLTQQSGVIALVNDRVYPVGESPKTIVYPYITYQKISNRHIRHMSVGSQLAASRFQINCWAKDASDADAVGQAVREAMDNRRGDIGTGGNVVNLRGSFLDSDDEDFEPPSDDSKVGRHNARLDLIIWHVESATPV